MFVLLLPFWAFYWNLTTVILAYVYIYFLINR